jgi:small GTP-binding protein
LALRFVEGYYREGRDATVGAFFLTRRLTISKMTCKLLLWDTAGQEQFQKLAKTYYSKAAAAIVCFDVSRDDSIASLSKWLSEITQSVVSQRIVLCVAACKCDLGRSKAHIEQQAQEIAQQYGALYVETSAKKDLNVNDLFVQVAEQVLLYQQEAVKGKGRPIPVTIGSSATSKTSSSRLVRSLSPQGRGTTKDDEGSNIKNKTPFAQRDLGADVRTNFFDEKKMDTSDDDITDRAARKPPSTTSNLICDAGMLGCTTGQDPGSCLMM